MESRTHVGEESTIRTLAGKSDVQWVRHHSEQSVFALHPRKSAQPRRSESIIGDSLPAALMAEGVAVEQCKARLVVSNAAFE